MYISRAKGLSVFYIQEYVVGPSGFNFIFIQLTIVPTNNALFQKCYSGIVSSNPTCGTDDTRVLFACCVALF